MNRFRPTLTYLFAAGYALVAVAVGGGHGFLHDHGGHSPGQVAEAGCHHHHGHGHAHHHEHAATHEHHEQQAPDHSCPPGEHDHSGCVVCQYLAQASLLVAIEEPPARSEACQPVASIAEQRLAADPLCPHPPRGPPAVA